MTQTQQYLMVNAKGNTVMGDEFMQRKSEFEMNLSYKIGSLKKDSPDYIGVYEAEWHTNESINADSLTSNSTSSGSDSEKSKSSDNYCSPSSKRSKLNHSPSISSLNKEITKRGVNRMQKSSCTNESKGSSGGYQFTIMKNVHIPRTSYLHYNNKDTKYSYDVFHCISMSNEKYIPEQINLGSNVEMQFTHQPRGVFNKGDPIYCDKHSNKCNNLLNLQASDKTKIFKTFAAKFENGSSVNEVVYINSTSKTVVSRTIAVKNPNPGMKLISMWCIHESITSSMADIFNNLTYQQFVTFDLQRFDQITNCDKNLLSQSVSRFRTRGTKFEIIKQNCQDSGKLLFNLCLLYELVVMPHLQDSKYCYEVFAIASSLFAVINQTVTDNHPINRCGLWRDQVSYIACTIIHLMIFSQNYGMYANTLVFFERSLLKIFSTPNPMTVSEKYRFHIDYDVSNDDSSDSPNHSET